MNLRDRWERFRIDASDRWGRLSPGAQKRLRFGVPVAVVLLVVAVVINSLGGEPRGFRPPEAPPAFESGENPAFALDAERLRAMSEEELRAEVSGRRDALARLGKDAPKDQLQSADAALRRAEAALAERGG